MGCIVIGTGIIECEDVGDPLRQRLHSSIGFDQSLSRAGSEWNRSLSSVIVMTQSDYLFETLADTISFVSSVEQGRDLPSSLSDTLVFVDIATVSGGRFPSGGGSGPDPVSAIFDTITKEGMALYVPSNGHVDLAQADSSATSVAVGFANEDVAAAATGDYITEGRITKSDWTTVTGSVTLTAGAYYYLSETTAGQITTTPPSLTGESVVAVARALTTTVLDIETAQAILL